jgi:hypothetical protein
MLRALSIALLAALLVVTGCDSAPNLSGRPTEADEAVLVISRLKVGDDPGTRLAALPVAALYGDGRVIRSGAQVAVEPAPALPSLQVTTLDSAGVDAVLAKAGEAGLVGADRELRMPTEADPTITAFDVFLNGQRRRTIVESLAEIAPDDPRLPPASQAERAAMNAVVAMLTDPASNLATNIVGEDAVYAPTAVGVLIAPAGGAPAAGGTPVEWPLDDLATIGEPVQGAADLRCVVVEGEDLTTLEPLASGANQETTWTSGGASYTLRFRPLLPGETGC